jgi:glycolate dehydrogenase FAD-binding subunit
MHPPVTQTAQTVRGEALWRELDALLPAEQVRGATVADAIDGVTPSRVVEPATTDETARVLKWATDTSVTVAPRGGATKMAWGNRPAAADVVLSTRRLDQVVEHAWEDMTVVVQAGCTIAALQSKLGKHGQHLALDALWPERATVGGVIATNDSGTFRLRYGSVRDLIIGATIALADGTVAKSGGKVVKNVAGYDLQKLMTGALGTLGVITEAIFRLHPKARETRSLTFHTPDVVSANELLLRVHDSQLVPTGIQLRTDSTGSCELDMRFEGIAQGVEAQIATLGTLTSLPHADADPQVWSTREHLWSGEQAVICKISVLPAQIAEVCKLIRGVIERWSVVAQSVGLITARLDGATLQQVLSLRHALETVHASLVVLECPSKWKGKFDVWGNAGDALPLMVRVKQQLDPAGTLNRGRYVGGI